MFLRLLLKFNEVLLIGFIKIIDLYLLTLEYILQLSKKNMLDVPTTVSSDVGGWKALKNKISSSSLINNKDSFMGRLIGKAIIIIPLFKTILFMVVFSALIFIVKPIALDLNIIFSLENMHKISTNKTNMISTNMPESTKVSIKPAESTAIENSVPPSTAKKSISSYFRRLLNLLPAEIAEIAKSGI